MKTERGRSVHTEKNTDLTQFAQINTVAPKDYMEIRYREPVEIDAFVTETLLTHPVRFTPVVMFVSLTFFLHSVILSPS